MPKFPGVSHKHAVAAFKKAGFWIAREGKHINMTNGKFNIIIPRGNPINAITMGVIIQGSGMTIEEF